MPFLIQGTLAEPSVIPDPVGTAVGAAKIAGMFINPLAAGAVLVAQSETAEENPCVVALENPAPASGDAATQPAAEKSAIESVTEGVGSAVEGVGEGISEGLKSLFGN